MKPGLKLYNKKQRIEAFWAKVKKTDSCWNWIGYVGKDGYGRFRFDGRSKGVHRFAYRLFIGKLKKGLEIDHLCRNRRCVNPKHLEQVDRNTNLKRGNSISTICAKRTHCPKGHPYDYVDMYGRRRCKKCWYAQAKKWRDKNPGYWKK